MTAVAQGTELAGWIRFNGGPWHNRHERLEKWEKHFDVPGWLKRAQALARAETQVVNLSIDTYELRWKRSAYGATYFEYEYLDHA